MAQTSTSPTSTGNHPDLAEIRHLIRCYSSVAVSSNRPFKVITDTSDFFRVNYHDVVVLKSTPYLILGYEKEGRFGLDDEPKYWVRRAIDLRNGQRKILKLVFHERFQSTIGKRVIQCFRSPKKEARILQQVSGHPHFMQGHAVEDRQGNLIRVLDYIHGQQYDQRLSDLGQDHHDFFYHHLPAELDNYIELVAAIQFLHQQGEKHGDIRRDHIIRDRYTQLDRWIDFDYDFLHDESIFGFDLHGLGNIIIFIVGRGDLLVDELYRQQPACFATLWGEDLSMSYKNRVANVQKVYPYIPDSLNRILLHFSQGAKLFYENTAQLLDDLAMARHDLQRVTGGVSL